MNITHRKIKSVAKTIVPEGERLEKTTLGVMKVIADVVGATLGPGGKQVLIERQEYGVPNLITKDGVTVFRSLGFNDPVAHAVMEAARDASVRTASEAGDGTTTATVLSEAFVRKVNEFCKANPKVSPQRVVRTMEKIFRTHIEPYIKGTLKNVLEVDDKLLYSVALTSANGDVELADAIAECFRLVGDDGNVTITEEGGPSGYKVEALKGFPVATGYEDSTGKFFSIFINDQANSRVVMDKPIFVLYHGSITEIQTLVPLMEKIGGAWGGPQEQKAPSNVVLVATGFSDSVIGELAGGWRNPQTINVYPVVAPKNVMQTGQLDFLMDLQAVTSSTIFDPVTRPIQQGELEDIGPALELFEATRYRSSVIGHADEGLVLARVEEVQAALENSEGELETRIMNERIGKLSGGIAKLRIFAPTTGELREKRDRAEDASCAWRGAVKHGALPGGGWALLTIIEKLMETYGEHDSVELSFEERVFFNVMLPAMEQPVKRLLSNCGYSDDEIETLLVDMHSFIVDGELKVYDALAGEFQDAKASGVVDSLPAVLEALRNSISIASLLGTMGGIVVFPRDPVLERQEAGENYQWMKDAGVIKDE